MQTGITYRSQEKDSSRLIVWKWWKLLAVLPTGGSVVERIKDWS